MGARASRPAPAGGVPALASTLHGLMAVGVRQRSRDLSLTSVSVLATLERSGPRRITDLAATEGVAQPSMTALVNSLEGLGLVERRRDGADRRVILVALTEDGAEYLARSRAAGAEAYTRLIDKLPPEHLKALLAAGPALAELLDMDGERADGPHRGGPGDHG